MKNYLLSKISILFLFFYSTAIHSQCFSKAGAGYGNTYGIKSDGSIWGWGFGNWGQLNNATDFDEYSPILLSNQNNWQLVKNCYVNTFAIKNDGTLWACGYNLYGELGIGSNFPNSDTFVQVGNASNWKDVISSQSQTIALKTDNTLWGWGQNDFYQVGNNNCCANVLSPVQISTDTDWKSITVSQDRTSFALKNNGTLWGWGANGGHMLGDSSVSVYQVPTQISTDTNWSNIASGENHILALKTNGTLWAWGDSGSGEAGHDGLTNPYLPSFPNQIPGTWSKITAGIRFSLGIKTDGTLWAWGKNDVGQLGTGTTTNTYIPVQVGTDSDWVSVSAGSEHVVALKSNGALYTWGGNYYGELGNGTTTGVSTPTNVPIAGCMLANESFAASSSTRFIISPNPAQNELNLTYKGTEVINTISIYDISGKEVFSTQPAATTILMATFSLAALQSGNYVVALKNNGKTIVSKQLVKE